MSPEDKAIWLEGFKAGHKRGAQVVAHSVDAVLDGYDFKGNALAKAVCDDYRETIRVRLRVALRETPEAPSSPQ